MKRFKNDNWSVCELKGKMCNLPLHCEASVYMIVIFKKGECRRKIVYVGSSRLLYGRIYNHHVIRKMRKNLKEHSIEIWHKSFGDYQNNLKEENKLIFKLRPPFNLGCSSGRLEDKIYEFWESMGVDKLIGSWGHKYTLRKRDYV